jgi:hypothetical protein
MYKISILSLFLSTTIFISQESSLFSVPLVQSYGTFKNISVDDSEVLCAAKFAVQEFNKKTFVINWAIGRIQSAKIQIVNGVNYEINVIIEKPGCKGYFCYKLGCLFNVFLKQQDNMTKLLTKFDCGFIAPSFSN